MPKLYRSLQFPQSCCMPLTCAITPGARTLRDKEEPFLTCPSCPYLAHSYLLSFVISALVVLPPQADLSQFENCMTQQLFSLVRRELILVPASWLSTHDLNPRYYSRGKQIPGSFLGIIFLIKISPLCRLLPATKPPSWFRSVHHGNLSGPHWTTAPNSMSAGLYG